MIAKLKQTLAFLKHARGDWSTKEKIVVIESDDWGSIRMPDKEAYDSLLKQGLRVNRCAYMQNDNLETPADFEALHHVLSQVERQTGKRPVITANYILANPDFKKIKQTDFQTYYRQYFWEYLKENGQFEKYQTAYNPLFQGGFFYPQLHGMEHLNIPYWMQFLQKASPETRAGFDQNVYGISKHVAHEKRDSFLPALDYHSEREWETFMSPALKKATVAFEQFFGYTSKSFIAPNYTWSDKVESQLARAGVQFLQSSRFQKNPSAVQSAAVRHTIGQKNAFNQRYLVRNCFFEPALSSLDKTAYLNRCLYQVKLAFLLHKPAIISAHRLNFMGGIQPENREENLKLFKTFLLKIIREWPEIRFLNSVDVGHKF